MMYLLFNEYGAIKDKQINEWIVQGSNNVNKIGVAIDGVNPTSFALVGVCKLPNGEVITTAPVDEQAEIVDGVYGVVFSLSKDITALEGTLRINIQAINTTTDEIITSYTVFLCVNEGVDPGEIVMMSADQYQNLLSKIELDVQQDETILKVENRTALGSPSQWENGQVFLCLYDSSYNNHKTLLHLNKLNPLYPYELIFDFNDHYTKDELDTMLNAKQNKLTVESLETAQLQYAVGFDANGNLKKGAGGGGGAIYTAGYGIEISDFQISVDTDDIATKLELSAVAEIAEGKNKGYVINTQSQITGTKDSDDNYTNVTAITGITLTDLHLGDIIYIKQTDVPDYWVSALVYSGDTLQSVSLNKMETSKVDLDNYVTLDSAQTITGIKTFTNGISFGGGTKIEKDSSDRIVFKYNNEDRLKIGNANVNCRCRLDADANNTYDLGRSGVAWKDLYLSGKIKDGTNEFNADNVFNVINASDIVNNTLTQAQYDLITNGKPTLIKERIDNRDNVVFFPAELSSGSSWQTLGMYYFHSGSDWKISTYMIDNRNKKITFYNNGFSAYGEVTKINNKSIDYYQNNVYPYATNSTTQIEYETINNISVSANTTFTLATAPTNTYPEYKANITNSGSSAINLTFTGVSVIKTNDTNITIASNVLTLPAGTTIECSIQNGRMIAFNWSAN